jgi:hypothetical protein
LNKKGNNVTERNAVIKAESEGENYRFVDVEDDFVDEVCVVNVEGGFVVVENFVDEDDFVVDVGLVDDDEALVEEAFVEDEDLVDDEDLVVEATVDVFLSVVDADVVPVEEVETTFVDDELPTDKDDDTTTALPAAAAPTTTFVHCPCPAQL